MSKSQPLYLRVKDRIREEFGKSGSQSSSSSDSSGEGPGLGPSPVRLPTLEDLQEQLQVSRPTISKALAALAAEGFLVKQAGRGTFALAPSAAALRAGPGGGPLPTIGYIAPLYAEELPQRVFVGIDRVAHRRGFRVVMTGSGDNMARERAAAHEMIASGVKALIIYPTIRQGDDREQDYLREEAASRSANVELNLPVVLIDTATPAQGHAQVVFDNKRAGYQIANWLLDHGHTRIGLVFYSESAHHPAIDGRLRGYQAALADRGLGVESHLIARIAPPGHGEQLSQAVEQLFDVPPAQQPTALIASDDMMAIELIQTLKKRGIAVPDDIFIAGFDNRTAARHYRPAFATTTPDFEQMGEVAAEMVIDAVESGQSRLAATTYILPVPLSIPTEARVSSLENDRFQPSPAVASGDRSLRHVGS